MSDVRWILAIVWILFLGLGLGNTIPTAFAEEDDIEEVDRTPQEEPSTVDDWQPEAPAAENDFAPPQQEAAPEPSPEE